MNDREWVCELFDTCMIVVLCIGIVSVLIIVSDKCSISELYFCGCVSVSVSRCFIFIKISFNQVQAKWHRIMVGMIRRGKGS